MLCEVFNAGVPGENSRVTLSRLPGLLERYSPTIVVLSTGANDVVNPAGRLPLSESRSNLKEMISRIRASGCGLILSAPPPVCFAEFLRKYPALQELVHSGLDEEYAAFRQMFLKQAKSARVPVADMTPAFAALMRPADSAESLTRNKANSGAYDGVHPTPQGHALLGALIAQIIQDLSLDPARTLCAGDSITHGYPLLGMGTTDGDNYPSMLRRILESL